jgi:prepilin-type N-terminal cleavage/methylation domain-containing protein
MKDILNKKGKDHGFTLLEIVICLGLIALVLVAVFHLQAQNLDLQSEAQFMTTATWLLQERLSQIQSLEEIEEGTNSGDFGKDYPDYTYKQEVSEVPDTEGERSVLDWEYQDFFATLLFERDYEHKALRIVGYWKMRRKAMPHSDRQLHVQNWQL